eukprot:Platyproteum_vivax@DN17509_c0_g1_i1.p1
MQIANILDNCRLLQSLVLNDTKVSDGAFATLEHQVRPCLSDLALHRCTDLTDAGVALFARGMPNLELLSLSACTGITDQAVKTVARYCTLLQRLRLDYSPLSNPGIKEIGKLSFITSLHIKCERMSGSVLSHFNHEKQQGLKVIEMYHDKVSAADERGFRER